MRYAQVLAFAAAAVTLAVPAHAQDMERYQLERTDDGYVRLDTETGAMALCQERGGRLVCAPATEEKRATGTEAGGLLARMDALESRIAALEAGRTGAAGLPSEDEFEQTMGYMERFFRRFMDIVTDLDREFGTRTPQPAPEPPPDRT